ncbi:BACON domain-containing protein [Sphingobacteriaceae bacterium WQ 2009]|uniref:BACON domain-containing protein n=1 Tax=Rhinopithecimicrobium faecis TaxID=2820698 RepID=A0A8T4HB46_9SPHI|nr:BACON domain-containing protein [Sphingobacteriaceae bacterium WQ 2009]
MKTKTFKIYSFFFLLSILVLSSCKKENLPVKPVAGTFEISHTFPATISNTQNLFELKILGSTNGWWVTATEGASWIVISRKYGSASHTQNITIQANMTGVARNGWIKVKSTSGEETIINFKQEK